MHRRTKALSISKAVKEKVWERDDGCCVYCGSPYALPEAHYIPRSQGGLGVEKNVLTMCRDCHRRFDQTVERQKMKGFFRAYLEKQYPDWNEDELIYKKGMN